MSYALRHFNIDETLVSKYLVVMCEIIAPPTSVVPKRNCKCDSDEDLTEDQIIDGLTKLTAESLADEPDY